MEEETTYAVSSVASASSGPIRGSHLATLRASYRVSKLGLSKAVGIPRTHITAWESQDTLIPAKQAEKLSDYFAGLELPRPSMPLCLCGQNATRIIGITLSTMDGLPTAEYLVLCEACYSYELMQRA